jgi:hypothetical protein
VADALALDASGSRMEDGYWERRLSQRLHRLLKNGSQTALDAALEHLFKHNADASDVLAEQAETLAESATIEIDGVQHDVLLIAAPILAHTRYAIPSGALKPELAQTLAVHLQAHVLATGTKVALSPYLYSIDQLPRSHSDTFALTHKLALPRWPAPCPRWTCAICPKPRRSWPIHAICWPWWWRRTKARCSAGRKTPRSTTPSDRPASSNGATRCSRPSRAAARLRVRTAAAGRLLPVVPRIGQEHPSADRARGRQLPVRHARCAGRPTGRRGGRLARKWSRNTAGFTMRGEKEVIYGIVWPVYGRESGEIDAEEKGNPVEQICEELRNAGVEDIFRHAALFDPEYCEDCGTPLYADRSGEIVHAELPEDAPTQQPLFH